MSNVDGATVKPGEIRYTLVEASSELARRRCMAHGHDIEHIIRQGSLDPVLAICHQCGKSWSMKAS